MESRTACGFEARSRQARPTKARLDVRPPDGIGLLMIGSGKEDDRLQWGEDGRVRVLIGKVLPEESAVKQALAGRRMRFRMALAVKGRRECGATLLGGAR